ncbi:unnamed protein product [Meloidogyne enterolobii]|uniref:Uncharacterized protein n=1 Tax=Meloidogyne enterolobii TaxID=390850 RepID=A0ACB0XK79_MELEN
MQDSFMILHLLSQLSQLSRLFSSRILTFPYPTQLSFFIHSFILISLFISSSILYNDFNSSLILIIQLSLIIITPPLSQLSQLSPLILSLSSHVLI